MKKAYLILFVISIFCSCNSEIKLNEEYEELVESYPSKFGKSPTIYNANKEYILRAAEGIDGFGIEIRDLSKLDLEHKVIRLRGFKDETFGDGRLEWVNDYVHEAIDNYTYFGESFYLIWPRDHQNPNLPKK